MNPSCTRYGYFSLKLLKTGFRRITSDTELPSTTRE
jgi:hypothetical protein